MRQLFFAYFFLLSGSSSAQNIDYAKKVINDLCSEKMYGRGYVKEGTKIAAEYIKKEYQSAGLSFFDNPPDHKAGDYFQEFGFPVVSFPYIVSVKLNDRELVPGEEYIVDAGCPPIKGTFDILFVDSSNIDNLTEFESLTKKNLRTTFLVLDRIKGKKFIRKENEEKILKNAVHAKGLIYANEEKLTWTVATEWKDFPVIYFMKNILRWDQEKISMTVESDLSPQSTQNVIGYIKGSRYPDSFVVFSAHYDHLGMMGKWALFPGANDNASGVAMMLDIMKYYAKNKPKYSIAFMAFTGEEAGLFGSYYYTQHPLFDLKKISILINLDLMGTGDKGMTVVNATLFPKEFQDLQLINITKGYLPTVNSRGTAKNSDHYYFSENGVKAFFFYLMGEYHFYHDVFDLPEALTLSRYKEAFKLIVEFTNEYCNGQ